MGVVSLNQVSALHNMLSANISIVLSTFHCFMSSLERRKEARLSVPLEFRWIQMIRMIRTAWLALNENDDQHSENDDQHSENDGQHSENDG